jgi:hypothetical protein
MTDHQPHLPRNQKGAGAGIAFLRNHIRYDSDECLLWPFSTKGPQGYGMVGYLGKLLCAHRVMCELAHGKPPTRKHKAAHTCALRPCVNPKHLLWRTLRETQLESVKRHPGYHRRGQPHKLTADQVSQIRALKTDYTQRELAGMFGVQERNISKILLRRTWATGEFSQFGGNTKRRLILPTKPNFETARFYIPRAIGFEFSEGIARVVPIVGPQQQETPFALLAALDKLHPNVRAFVLAVIDGAEMQQAATEARIGADMLARLLPRLRAFLTPYVRVAA